MVNIAYAQEKQDWRILKSTHFIVHYKNASEDFIEKLIENAESYYDKIADDLGFRRFNFWSWENRAKIYIQDNAKEYQEATGQPAWSSGCVFSAAKIIHSFPFAHGFFDTVLPHEMGHIIFREFVGFDNSAVPVWLDEGVASYQGNFRSVFASRRIKMAMADGKFMNIEALSNFDFRQIQDQEAVDLFYAEAVGIVDYLVKEFGKDKFVLFCQNLRDRRDLERAISSTYPFSNLEELNQAWEKYLKNE